MASFVIESAEPWMPDGLTALEAEARLNGIANVSTLISRWVDGSERYQRAEESLLVSINPSSESVIGVGGLMQCPNVDGALRMRRFYVAVEWRRRGVARAVASRLIEFGLAHTDTLTCNAQASSAAPGFWEALGFRPVDVDGITHVREA